MVTDFEKILEKVCTFFQVERGEVLSKDSTKPLPDARHILIYELSKNKKYSQRRIAKQLNMKQSNVYYAIQKPNNDTDFKELLTEFNNL